MYYKKQNAKQEVFPWIQDLDALTLTLTDLDFDISLDIFCRACDFLGSFLPKKITTLRKTLVQFHTYVSSVNPLNMES